MVQIIIKKSAFGGLPAIKESKAYPNADYDEEVPDFAELEEWAEEVLAAAGYEVQSFQMILDDTPLQNGDTVTRISAFGSKARVVLKIQLPSSDSDALSLVDPPSSTPVTVNVQTRTASTSRSSPDDVTEVERSNVKLLSVALDLENQLEKASSAVNQGGSNVLVEAAKYNLKEWADIKETAMQLRLKGYDDVADKLINKAQKTYDHALTELTVFHSTGWKMCHTFEEFAKACNSQNVDKAKRLICQSSKFALKLSTKSKEMEKEFSALKEDLEKDIVQLHKQYSLKRSKQRGFNAGAAVSGVGGAGLLGAGAMAGVTTETTGILGFGAANVWNPVGVGCLAVGGSLAVAGAVFGAVASSYGAAKETADQMKGVTETVHDATQLHTDMWKGMALTSSMLENGLEDLEEMSFEDRQMYESELKKSLTHLTMLMSSQDEYLVYMAESKLYPLSFDARMLVGEEKYDRLKAVMSMKLNPMSSETQSEDSA